MFSEFILLRLFYNVASDKRTFYVIFTLGSSHITKLTVEMKQNPETRKFLLNVEYIILYTIRQSSFYISFIASIRNGKDATPYFFKFDKRDHEISKGTLNLSEEKNGYHYLTFTKSGKIRIHFTVQFNDSHTFMNITRTRDSVQLNPITTNHRFFVTEHVYIDKFEEILSLKVKKVPTPSQWLNISRRAKKNGYSFVWSAIGLSLGLFLSTFIGFMRQSNTWRF